MISSSADSRDNPDRRNRVRWLWSAVLLLSLAFAGPLSDLFRYATANELHSHTLLIPFISLYLVWIERRRFAALTFTTSWSGVWVAGLPALMAAGFAVFDTGPAPEDRLSCLVFSYIGLIIAVLLGFLGRAFFRAFRFQTLFLLLTVPLPLAVADAVAIFFQHATAGTVDWMFQLSGTPVFREGLTFQLPGLMLEVAQQCSGIRSSLVLFITGLLAGHLFLNRGVSRWIMALVFVPLGILRNAFRILTLALLTIHVDPNVIHGPLHHRGGPVFFVLSLIPFFLLLLLLRKREPGKGGRLLTDRA